MYLVVVYNDRFGSDACRCFSFESLDDAQDFAKQKFEEGYRNIKVSKEVPVTMNVNIAI